MEYESDDDTNCNWNAQSQKGRHRDWMTWK